MCIQLNMPMAGVRCLAKIRNISSGGLRCIGPLNLGVINCKAPGMSHYNRTTGEFHWAPGASKSKWTLVEYWIWCWGVRDPQHVRISVLGLAVTYLLPDGKHNENMLHDITVLVHYFKTLKPKTDQTIQLLLAVMKNHFRNVHLHKWAISAPGLIFRGI